jgi:hypothetical protein
MQPECEANLLGLLSESQFEREMRFALEAPLENGTKNRNKMALVFLPTSRSELELHGVFVCYVG